MCESFFYLFIIIIFLIWCVLLECRASTNKQYQHFSLYVGAVRPGQQGDCLPREAGGGARRGDLWQGQYVSDWVRQRELDGRCVCDFWGGGRGKGAIDCMPARGIMDWCGGDPFILFIFPFVRA